MCGITGYVGAGDSLPVVAASLKNLEYRGYDSAGVALDDGVLRVHKQQGVIEDLELPSGVRASRAIGHTRWSTHGEPTDENAHPHTDCTDTIAVVHNGIIENYDELRAELSDRPILACSPDFPLRLASTTSSAQRGGSPREPCPRKPSSGSCRRIVQASHRSVSRQKHSTRQTTQPATLPTGQ